MNYRPPERAYELWDSWVIADRGVCHLFHLCRDWWSGDGVTRNYVGHATSMDLLHWTTHDYITLFSGHKEDWDSNQRILTGNTFRDADGVYYMTYGSARPDGEGGPSVARVGLASSLNLFTWTKSAANPILVPAPPYLPADENRSPLRDASICVMPDGRYEAIFCTRRSEGPFYRRGVVGRALSDDLAHWDYVEPLLQTDRIQEPEVPSRYQHGGRHYLLFCAGFGLAGRTQYRHYPVIDKATYYAVANAFEGPFRFSMQNVLTPGSAYVGRIVQFGGLPLYFHHIQTKRSGFAIPKVVKFNGDEIVLTPWGGISSIFTGREQRGFGGFSPTLPWMRTSRHGDTVVADAEIDPVIIESAADWRDVHLSVAIRSRCAFAGIQLRAGDAPRALAVIYERDSDRVTITRTERPMRYRALPFDYSDVLGIYECGGQNANQLRFTLTLRSDAMDLYIGGKHVYTVTVEGVAAVGRVGLYADGGVALHAR